MLHRLFFSGCCALVSLALLSTPCFAADWFHIGDTHFAARLPITIENPADVDDPAVVFSMKLADLGEKMPAATKNTIGVADDKHELIPVQAGNEWMTFVVPVKAHEKKTVYIYAAKSPVQLPRFEKKTGTDSREAWRSFENEFMAFRVEVGDKSKTTGLAIDIFGKTHKGRGAILKDIYASDYHKPQPWGIDVMKVSHGPGLGGVYLYLGQKMGRTSAGTTTFRVLYEGPIKTCVIAEGPVEIDGKKLKVTRSIDLAANDRTLFDTVTVDGPADVLKDIKIGIGLRDLPEQKWIERPQDGYAGVVGKGNQEGTDQLGLGVVFDPKDFVRMQTIEHETDGGHVYVLTPHHEGEQSVHVHSRLMAFWNGDGWVSSAEQFESLLQQYASLWKSPAKITIADTAETR
jgi:hypothetical protein